MNVKLYTKTGDSGETSLVGGERVSKGNSIIDLYGELDELNSWIGLLNNYLDNNGTQDFLAEIQKSIFEFLTGVKDDFILKIESHIDDLENRLPSLTIFILPGGNLASSYSHIARTVCRRVERKAVLLRDGGVSLPKNSLIFLNRLSDYLFCLARSVNS